MKHELKIRPEGWQLVPVNPTGDMLNVVIEHGHFSSIQPEMASKYYRAMLAAAPEPDANLISGATCPACGCKGIHACLGQQPSRDIGGEQCAIEPRSSNEG